MFKSHPMMIQNFMSAEQKAYIKLHAEVAALLSVNDSLINSRTSVYVYRSRRDGHQGMAKPCHVCTRFIQSMGIKKVYFSLDYKGFGEMILHSGD